MHNNRSLPRRLLRIIVLIASGQLALINTAHAESRDGDGFNLYAKDNLVAWCVVPYDSQERTPAQRARMLQELGVRSLAWDWRQKHLDSLEEEISQLEHADIDLKAVWCWIDDEAGGGLSGSNEQVLATLAETGTKTTIWVGFAARYFAGLNDDEKVEKAAETIANLRAKAEAIGCRVSLYNHGDWFGEPLNMVKVLRRLGVNDVGLVYNFHHAHTQLDAFKSNLDLMMPYLDTVNLNGMRAEGPKILTLGSGDREEAMMRQLKEAGFRGQIGILGHVEDADVRDVLTENLSGMKELLRRMGETQALKTYE